MPILIIYNQHTVVNKHGTSVIVKHMASVKSIIICNMTKCTLYRINTFNIKVYIIYYACTVHEKASFPVMDPENEHKKEMKASHTNCVYCDKYQQSPADHLSRHPLRFPHRGTLVFSSELLNLTNEL